jgi:hypothetical protein
LGPLLPEEHLRIALSEGAAPTARKAQLSGSSTWAARLQGIADA